MCRLIKCLCCRGSGVLSWAFGAQEENQAVADIRLESAFSHLFHGRLPSLQPCTHNSEMGPPSLFVYFIFWASSPEDSVV